MPHQHNKMTDAIQPKLELRIRIPSPLPDEEILKSPVYAEPDYIADPMDLIFSLEDWIKSNIHFF